MSDQSVKNSSPQPNKKPFIDKSKLVSTTKTLQFSWFIGHTITLLSIFFYTLTYFRIGRFYKFWYQLSLIGILESFGILIYQILRKKGFQTSTFLKDDNVQYFLLGVVLLILRPYVLLTILPFALFSLFHVLAYIKGYLLPIFGLEEHPITKRIGDFISKNNSRSVEIASMLEIYTLGWLFVRLVACRTRSLAPFIFYLIFIKFRYEKSVFTRNYIKSLEVETDNLVNRVNVPIVKQYWIKFKEISRRISGIYILNDYTKEKAN